MRASTRTHIRTGNMRLHVDSILRAARRSSASRSLPRFFRERRNLMKGDMEQGWRGSWKEVLQPRFQQRLGSSLRFTAVNIASELGLGRSGVF
jgi:hypothetical protein